MNDVRGWTTCVVCTRLRSTLDEEGVCPRCRKAVDAGHLTIPEHVEQVSIAPLAPEDRDKYRYGSVGSAEAVLAAEEKLADGICPNTDNQPCDGTCADCPTPRRDGNVLGSGEADLYPTSTPERKQKPVKSRWWKRNR